MKSVKKFEASLKAFEKAGPSTLSFMESQSCSLDKDHFEELVTKGGSDVDWSEVLMTSCVDNASSGLPPSSYLIQRD